MGSVYFFCLDYLSLIKEDFLGLFKGEQAQGMLRCIIIAHSIENAIFLCKKISSQRAHASLESKNSLLYSTA